MILCIKTNGSVNLFNFANKIPMSVGIETNLAFSLSIIVYCTVPNSQSKSLCIDLCNRRVIANISVFSLVMLIPSLRIDCSILPCLLMMQINSVPTGGVRLSSLNISFDVTCCAVKRIMAN